MSFHPFIHLMLIRLPQEFPATPTLVSKNGNRKRANDSVNPLLFPWWAMRFEPTTLPCKAFR
jgi:hypothetical protein